VACFLNSKLKSIQPSGFRLRLSCILLDSAHSWII